MPSLTVENYVKTIYLIAGRNPDGRAVATGEIAQALGVSPGTVASIFFGPPNFSRPVVTSSAWRRWWYDIAPSLVSWVFATT